MFSWEYFVLSRKIKTFHIIKVEHEHGIPAHGRTKSKYTSSKGQKLQKNSRSQSERYKESPRDLGNCKKQKRQTWCTRRGGRVLWPNLKFGTRPRRDLLFVLGCTRCQKLQPRWRPRLFVGIDCQVTTWVVHAVVSWQARTQKLAYGLRNDFRPTSLKRNPWAQEKKICRTSF